ncbi:MAG: D-alanyl-D-alanine carboxypeptidase [Ruminococcus sp.]|jgi:D-alanyl-D-alanine carboxypeptidase (penicillin-binding protein 5/6)|nr:D-alanyl-D-alanine carboxypeptidase [Ruminococcus sp.]
MKILICIVVSIVITVTFTFNVSAAENVTSDSESAKLTPACILFDVKSGKILYEKNAETSVPVGVMNKLMTILTAAEAVNSGKLSFDDTAVASAAANSVKGASVWLETGDEITIGELFRAVIIGNANDAAIALAEAVSGTESKFLEAEKRIAEELGLESTIFTNVHGYENAEEQISTAADLAKIISALNRYENDFLSEFFVTSLDYVRGDKAQLVNSNRLVRDYKGCIGYKYGTSKATGECLAAAAERGSNTYGIVLLSFPDEDKMFEYAEKLLDAGFENFTSVKAQIPDDLPQSIKIRNGYTPEVNIKAAEGQEFTVRRNQAQNIEIKVILPEYIYAPVFVNQKVGEIHYYIDNNFVYKIDIYADGAAEQVNFKKNIVLFLQNIFSFD